MNRHHRLVILILFISSIQQSRVYAETDVAPFDVSGSVEAGIRAFPGKGKEDVATTLAEEEAPAVTLTPEPLGPPAFSEDELPTIPAAPEPEELEPVAAEEPVKMPPKPEPVPDIVPPEPAQALPPAPAIPEGPLPITAPVEFEPEDDFSTPAFRTVAEPSAEPAESAEEPIEENVSDEIAMGAEPESAEETPEEAQTEEPDSGEAEEAAEPGETPQADVSSEGVKEAEPAIEKAPAEAEVEVEEEAEEDKAIILTKERKKKQKPVISLADVPKTPKEKQILEGAIGSVEQPSIDTAPAIDGQKFKRVKEIKQEKILLGGYVEPWRDLDTDETVVMSFEDSELKDLLTFLESNLNVTFILDDDVNPAGPGLKPLGGTRITFTSHVPMTLKQVWEVGVTFLEMAGFSLTPTTLPRTYHVTESYSDTGQSANNAPLPTYIGSDPELLPDSDIKVRYVYFVQNFDLDEMVAAIEALSSGSSGKPIKFPQLRGVIVTDKASYIKSYMKILREIDTVTMADSLAIIRLKHSDARQIQKLYLKLIGTDDRQYGPWHMRNRKAPTTHYFTKETRVFAEPRTNSLVVLGTRDNIKKFEDFVFKHFDKKLDLPYSPLHIHQLHHINAEKMADIINKVIQGFYSAADEGTKEAIDKGGVREGQQFIRRNVKIVAEPSGNRLIINADYEEYLKIRDILDKLDIPSQEMLWNWLFSTKLSLSAALDNKRQTLPNAKEFMGGSRHLAFKYQTAVSGSKW